MLLLRRRFIQSGLVCAVNIAINPNAILSAEQTKIVSIGFQLYTVRAELVRNVPDTINNLAQIGYNGVEFWDYAGTPNVYQHYSAGRVNFFL
jgi:hypothetical protein